MRAHISRLIEPGRRKHALHQVGNVVAALAESHRQGFDVAGIGHFVHEEAVNFGDQKPSGRGLLQNDLQYVFAREVAGATQKRLGSRVVVLRPKPEIALVVVAPTGESAGGFLHVLLGIVAPAQRKELHHLAGKVLVGTGFAVLLVVEELQHGRLAAHGKQ
ncbi:hypothetical protein BEN48_16855 [Hymenobacter glacialis]|uniref:Uncharacterized protein n=1 Tax=Hymenobacter glacialis TaxID=1908236 RepID=A0A1G1SYE6_9BACT|nr:hypothetical protein BEN48_16855 [Hymenobacter glacialis]